LVTLGTLFAFAGVAQIVTGGVPRPYVGPVSSEITSGTFSVGSLEITYMTVIGIAVAVGATIFALTTVPGHYLYAVGGGEVAARLAV
jgi:ribose/xylose/arabinose/galactoside ABC-type transport system permease subunit